LPVPGGIHYAAEKFYTAVRALTGPGSQRRRLADAYVYHFVTIKSEMLPEATRYRFKEFCEAITRVPGTGEGAVEASVARMSDNDVIDMVNEILGLYAELQSALNRL
jgi:hypothetical protein